MGMIFHITTTVVGFKQDIEDLHAFTKNIFSQADLEFCEDDGLEHLVTHVQCGMNGYNSFAILPHGSKEGWITQQEYDECLEKVHNRALKHYEYPLDIVTTRFGGDRVHMDLPYAETE